MNLVRLTQNEWDQLQLMPIATKFWHVNLQHSGLPIDQIGDIYQARLITKHGRETPNLHKDPKLDSHRIINLQLINLDPSLSIANLKLPMDRIFLLSNSNGILESLVDRYKKVRSLRKEEILHMECYLREFVKI